MFNKIKQLKKDKRGVFGLNAVQQFFGVILGLTLLAYVIVIIMGVLSTANIVPLNSLSGSVVNESILKPTTAAGVNLAAATLVDGTCGAISAVFNSTGSVIATANFTQTNCNLVNTTTVNYGPSFLVTYAYTYSNTQVNDGRSILGNVSAGVSSFFGAINPVYAILAILVIILVLVVLVRVVQVPSGSSTPSL